MAWKYAKRCFGLASRAIIVTLERFLDCWSIAFGFQRSYMEGNAPGLLLFGLVLTSALMAFTLQKHWSALRRGRPHGPWIGSIMSICQLAAFWEMMDKILFADRPREDFGLRQPLLRQESSIVRDSNTPPGQSQHTRSDLPKGSPGENIMRGVRKMSMINLPQAMLSLWVHARQLAPVGAGVTYAPPVTNRLLGLAFAASYLCVAFGIADFVLYIWVYDAFVRENKKLVTLHYLVEIFLRVPVVVLFHVAYSRQFPYSYPTIVCFCVDVCLTSILLALPRTKSVEGWSSIFVRPWRHITKKGLLQIPYSLVVSILLFVVNIVFFDPGMNFFYVNNCFYIIKYVEILLMLHLIRGSKLQGIPFVYPSSIFDIFWWVMVACGCLNAFLVFFWVPRKRQERVAQLIRSTSEWHSESAVSPRRLNSPRHTQPADSSPVLEHLEEIFEMLRMLSISSCGRNRARLLTNIVSELWHQALQWDGAYVTPKGEHVLVSVDRITNQAKVSLSSPDQCIEVRGMLEGPKIMLQGPVPSGTRETTGSDSVSGPAQGYSDGCSLRWENGEVWPREELEGRAAGTRARSVFNLILPQLALALRWDTASPAPFSGTSKRANDGPGTTPKIEEFEDLQILEPRQGQDGSGQELAGPLLLFLVQYAVMTEQSDFLCDLYWALNCHREEEKESEQGPKKNLTRSYRSIFLTFLKMLDPQRHSQVGTVLFWDRDTAARSSQFLQEACHQMNCQRRIWDQKRELLKALGHIKVTSCTGCAAAGPKSSGSGAWIHRTDDLRAKLRNWSEVRKPFKVDQRGNEEWELLQAAPQQLHDEETLAAASDLVHPSGDVFVSWPVDPTLWFRGIDISECSVIPSKHAPLLFTCSTTAPDDVDQQSVTKEKYLLKTGDDLRQDQLMLQIMALMGSVWKEVLPAEDVRLLELANFRVLAVTPHSGYVKFVPDAYPLTDVLHQCHGDLLAWLERNRPRDCPLDKVLDTLSGSVAASSVVTYILGIGDRHLENLCITKRGLFFHIDFSFVLGDDPKAFAPQVRLPAQVAQVLEKTGRYNQCFDLAAHAYCALRPFAGLWGSLLSLTGEAGGGGCPKLAREPDLRASVAGVRERLRMESADENRAASEFLCLVRESSEGLASIVMDKVHAAGLFWR